MKKSFWESRLYKGLKIALILLPVLLIIAGTMFALRYLDVKKRGNTVDVIEKLTYTEKAPEIGRVFHAEVLLRLPWHDSISGVSAKPGEKLQLVKEPEAKRVAWRWGYSDYRISLPLQGVRTGDSTAGKLQVSFKKASQIEFELPVINLKSYDGELGDEKQLDISPERVLPRKISLKHCIFIGGIACVIILAIIAVILWRKKRREQMQILKLTAGETALLAIEDLRERFQQGKISSEYAISLLTDIERKYLETRFSCKAERQTTDEFLTDLESKRDLLPGNCRLHLKSFLTAADMVKFARLPADTSLFFDAIQAAKELVTATALSPEEQKKEKSARNKSGGNL